MSARAPLGRPSKNNGSAKAHCTIATMKALSVSDVISQADATSFIHSVRLALSQPSHSRRNSRWRSGLKVDDAGPGAGCTR